MPAGKMNGTPAGVWDGKSWTVAGFRHHNLMLYPSPMTTAGFFPTQQSSGPTSIFFFQIARNPTLTLKKKSGYQGQWTRGSKVEIVNGVDRQKIFEVNFHVIKVKLKLVNNRLCH